MVSIIPFGGALHQGVDHPLVKVYTRVSTIPEWGVYITLECRPFLGRVYTRVSTIPFGGLYTRVSTIPGWEVYTRVSTIHW